ncbi:MAG: SDR family oxidoreductase [Actinobacteria bacterium]|nr:SDR family oxidoreductase [Actinomycetota bacterium]
MTGRLGGKVALITGGASGIGRACALRFAEDGAAVAVADLDTARAAEVAERIVAAGGRAVAVGVDVADEAAVEAMADATVHELGGIDLCVAAAGISHAGYVSSEDGDARTERGRPRGVGPILDKSLEDWQRVLDVDLTGVFLTDRAVIRRMVAVGRGGAVVNIASGAAQVAIAGSVEYSVAKTGVWMLTKGFAVEVGRHGIRVNAVGPGVIETPMTAELRRAGRFVEKIERATPLGRLGRPEDIAAACAFLCSDDASFVTGEILYPDGGYLAPQRL